MCLLRFYIMRIHIYLRDTNLSNGMDKLDRLDRLDKRQFSSRSAPNRSRSPSPQHEPRHLTTLNKDIKPIFIHPLVDPGRKAVDDHGEGSGISVAKTRSKKPPDLKSGPARRTTSGSSRTASIASKTGISELIDAQLKVSLAAKQLATQISESKGFWIMFREKFEEQVKEIKYYAGQDIIQQLWERKIQHDSKFRNHKSQKHQQFSFPLMGLEACVSQINDAADALTECLRKTPSKHDSRQLALDKIRTAGELVLELAERSIKSSSACADLVMEACNLERLVDPKSPEARIIHQFDRRETKSTHGDETETGPNLELDMMEDQVASDNTVIHNEVTF